MLKEAVTLTAHRTHSTRQATQLRTQTTNMHVNRTLMRMLVTGAPQRLQQLLTTHGAGRVLHQVCQQLEFLEGQHERLTIQEHLAACQIDQHTRRVAIRGLCFAGDIRLRVHIHCGRITERITYHLKVATLSIHRSQRHSGVRLRLGSQVVCVSAQILNDTHQGGTVRCSKFLIQTNIEHKAACLIFLSLLMGRVTG